MTTEEFARMAVEDACSILRNPFEFFESIGERKDVRNRTMRYILAWFTMFSTIPSLLIPVWKPLTDWATTTAVVKIPDLHFGNAAYLSMSRHIYPLIYSYLGDHLWTWLACIPILMADLLTNLLFGAVLFHLVFKHVLGGRGQLRDAFMVVAFGDLPSLLFGFLPYSVAIGLAWASLLQIPVGFHYLYKVSWNRAFVPYVLWTLLVFVSWGTWERPAPPD